MRFCDTQGIHVVNKKYVTNRNGTLLAAIVKKGSMIAMEYS